jgi:hypothetical protein
METVIWSGQKMVRRSTACGQRENGRGAEIAEDGETEIA